MKKSLLRNGTLIGFEPLRLERCDLLIVEGRIAAKGQRLTADRDTQILDCRNRFILPGFVNAHFRPEASQTLGMPRPNAASLNGDSKESIWRRVEEAHTPETVLTSAFAGALDAVRSGTTSLLAQHASAAGPATSLPLIRDAFQTIGVRAMLSFELGDRRPEYASEAAVREAGDFAEAHQSDKFVGAIGTSALEELADETLDRVAAESVRTRRPLQIALDEAPLRDAGGATGSAVARLGARGLLRPGAIFAHGTHVAPADLQAIKESGAWLVHCPTSNMMSGSGFAPWESFGDLAALGSDRAPADPFAEMRAALAQARARGARVGAEDVLRLAVGGHQLASEIFGLELGSLLRDAGADLVVVNYFPRTPLHDDNIADHVVLGMGAQHVESVIIEGHLVYHQGRFPEIDMPRLGPLIHRGAQQLWEALSGQAPAGVA